MKITAITQQKRNKSFYNIHIDYEYFCSLDDETIHNMKLKEGLEVDGELLKVASEKAAYKKAMNYALGILSKYYKTKQELIKKLKEKEYSETAIHDVIERLSELGYLNDQSFVETFISSKQGTDKSISKRALYNKLVQKGVDKELIMQGLENADIDEYQSAMLLAEKKLKSLKGSEKEKKTKLYNFLLYKGFSYEICTNIINKIEFSE